MNASDFIGILPEMILTVTAALLLFLEGRKLQYISLFGLALAFVSLFWLPSGRIFFGMVEINMFALLFAGLFLGMTFLIVLGSQEYIEKEKNQAEYYALMLFATAGMLVVAGAADLISLFIGFELSSLSTYALSGYMKRDEASTEAATKFFIIGALSSSIALYGISLIYGISKTTDIAGLASSINFAELGLVFNLGLALLIAGFGFKITAVPFHMWAPDVYQGAPTTISALLATGSKKMGFAALFKILLAGLLILKLEWIYLLAALAVLTMTVGNLLAIPQNNIKRMLAYSSVAQAGYIMIAFPVGTEYGLAGGLFHVVTHSLMTVGAFLAAAALSTAGISDNLEDYKGLSKREPSIAFAMAVFLLSLVGLPPLAGFASKFVLFSSAVDAAVTGERWMVWLAVAGVVNSALSLYYYARVIKYMYVDEAKTTAKITVPKLMVYAIGLSLILVILLGLFPNQIINFSLQAAGALLK